VLALVLSASVIEPVEPQDGQPVGVFVPICDHAVDALTAILWALGPTIDRHARQFGIPPLEPAGMTLMVRRATRAGTPGLLAHPVDAGGGRRPTHLGGTRRACGGGGLERRRGHPPE
jgi:hypothetical protein